MAVEIFLLSQFYSLFVLTVVTDAESCPNQNITDWSGTFQPSSYPSAYAPNLDCYWLIQVADGNLIEINFQDFAMDGVTSDNCSNDYVEVLEGSYGSNDSIKRLCGLSLPFEDEYRVVRSNSSSLLVHMHTDAADQNRGFAASHQGICQVTFSTVSGTIMSPSHPDKYPNSVKCEWIIDLGPGYDVSLTFHKFNLEKKDDCSWDWLTVQAGNTPDSPEIIRACGDVLPPDITTSGAMRIYFETDNDNEFEGFHMTWVAEVALVQNATESVQIVAGNITVPTTQAPNPVTAATVDIRSANSREFVQSIADVVPVPTTQTPNPVTATVDIRSANSKEFVQSGAPLSKTLPSTSASDPVTSVKVDKSVAASKTEPWLSCVVLIATISCFNLLSSN